MLKMFTTQLTGLLNRIHEKEEFAFEDGARLLAQATVGDGNIYVYGVGEMKAVEAEAIHGAEPLTHAKVLHIEDVDSLQLADRVILVTRYTHDEKALQIGKSLLAQGIPFISIATHVNSDGESLADISDVHIDLNLKKGLLPDEVGNRFGYPASMAALFVYYGLKFTLDEIIAENEEELD
ncbi:DUF2529 domain-containing protein [Bacillus sp. 31A1R]|uniref:DUF2529 domain-containing protein n=1 Tax=Robertmurraya mangrovi TaxID=3098077 RepID=A0ABU5IX82_9BACI|nr:DUF2529 domain-containing protein [Bacillus sp. 31A1R]MDZ5471784.1 DUF2529 domain-containing protein [Bacillus sp. 31A1R]